MQPYLRAIIAACAAGAVLALAACGGGSGGLSGPEYFSKLQALDDASEARQEELASAYDTAVADLPDGEWNEERAAAEGEFWEQLLAAGKEYVNGVDDLDPPGKVEDAHDEYVAAYDEVLIEIGGVVDALPGIASVEALDGVLTSASLTAAYDRANTACAALQAAAPEVDAQVDLRCR